jgi:hypothetical protein
VGAEATLRATSRGLTSAAGAGLARFAAVAGSSATALGLPPASVCTSDGGRRLKDTVDDGVVLLIADARVDVPATAEILDAKGSLLASHSAF